MTSTAKPEYWSLLGLKPDSDPSQLKRAFRREARKWHPDLNINDVNAEERFKLVNEAYAVLSDPVKKAEWENSKKLDLEFDLNTLRISDLPDEEQESSPAADIYATLKKKSTLSKVKAGLVENQVVEDNVNHSDKLRSMLKGME